MITTEQGQAFAMAWIDAWNSHDIEAILGHYADEMEFYSPFIPLLRFNDTGVITSKTDLSRYFKIGLNTYPNLHFRLHNIFTGVDTVTVYYTSVNGRMAAEVFQLNEIGKAIKVFCHYSSSQSQYGPD